MAPALKNHFAPDVFSRKVFLSAFAFFFACLFAVILICGMTGSLPAQPGIGITVDIEQAENAQPKKPDSLKPEDMDLHSAGATEDAIAGLHETSPYGMVPVIRASDKLTAFQAYRAPFTIGAESKGIIALAVVDFGLNKSASDMAVNIPGLNFVLPPYLNDAQNSINMIRQKGGEAWISLPLQPSAAGTDNGPNTLRIDLSPEDYQKRLLQSLAIGTGYVGAVSTGQSSFTADDFAKLNGILNGRGLAMVDAGNPQLWLDNDLTPASIQARLSAAEQTAIATGRVIIFMHPYPALLKQVQEWSGGLAAKALQLAPLSAVIDQKK